MPALQPDLGVVSGQIPQMGAGQHAMNHRLHVMRRGRGAVGDDGQHLIDRQETMANPVTGLKLRMAGRADREQRVRLTAENPDLF